MRIVICSVPLTNNFHELVKGDNELKSAISKYKPEIKEDILDERDNLIFTTRKIYAAFYEDDVDKPKEIIVE